MISVDISKSAKHEKGGSPLSLEPQKEGGGLSFSELLKGLSDKKDSKLIQNGTLVLALDERSTQVQSKDVKDDKKSVGSKLLDLLSSSEKDSKKDLIEVNPKLSEMVGQVVDTKDIKKLIADAKKYLKQQIVNSDAFKKSEIENLPKTLKGLATVASKMGIDISKITLEDVKSSGIKTQSSLLDAKEVKQETKIVEKVVEKQVVNEHGRKSVELEQSRTKIIKEIMEQPIFKSTKEVKLTTEQLVMVKDAKLDNKQASKTKSETTLESLLRAKPEKASSLNSEASDADVAEMILRTQKKADQDIAMFTEKTTLANQKSDKTKSLESLLGVKADESTSKLDGLSLSKADALEVKINEAKQMVKYLSQDVKKAIEDYKAPFTRIKVQLNPHKLGEVDLTVVQRGKNLVVNLSSNNAAINTLAMNANELRTQLNNSGINNATLNFSDSSQGDAQNSAGQQNRQNEQKAHNEYSYFENDEQNEEVLSSLEIVVPNYA